MAKVKTSRSAVTRVRKRRRKLSAATKMKISRSLRMTNKTGRTVAERTGSVAANLGRLSTLDLMETGGRLTAKARKVLQKRRKTNPAFFSKVVALRNRLLTAAKAKAKARSRKK